MRIKTILLALIMGTSTVAMAQPQRPGDYDRYDKSHYDRRGRVVNQWLTLAAGIPNDNYRHMITVGAAQGRFEKVRLSIDSGRVFVRQIAVIFTDGSTHKVRVDRNLRAGEVAQVDLPGRFRAINRVVVYTNPARRYRNTGTYSVVAQRPAIRPQYGYDRNDRDQWHGEWRRGDNR